MKMYLLHFFTTWDFDGFVLETGGDARSNAQKPKFPAPSHPTVSTIGNV